MVPIEEALIFELDYGGISGAWSEQRLQQLNLRHQMLRERPCFGHGDQRRSSSQGSQCHWKVEQMRSSKEAQGPTDRERGDNYTTNVTYRMSALQYLFEKDYATRRVIMYSHR